MINFTRIQVIPESRYISFTGGPQSATKQEAVMNALHVDKSFEVKAGESEQQVKVTGKKKNSPKSSLRWRYMLPGCVCRSRMER